MKYCQGHKIIQSSRLTRLYWETVFRTVSAVINTKFPLNVALKSASYTLH